MEMASENQESVGFLSRGCCWFTSFMRNLASKLVLEPARTARSLAREDPRRIIHSIKVGLAIALVSLIYYFDPLYEGFGVSAMWAVMTVVVVFEFSVGATLGRCVNRGIGTFIGGALGVAAHRLASCFGSEIVEPIILAVSIFIFAASGTFARFFPKWKARCDYGLLIFILTFCLISVSGYRDDEVIDIALTRLSTVMIGGSAALAICILLFPVWAGEDLHHLVADNIEKLGDFLEGFGDEYFKTLEDGNVRDSKALLEKYKSVVNSKTIEDNLVNFAKWEFRHGKFRFRHPWGEYQKIGGLIRECAFRLDSLNGYLKSEVQTPQEIREIFQESCQTMSSESSHALKNMARAIRTMTSSYVAVAKSHIAIAKSAADNLKSLLKTNSWQQTDLLQIIPVITVASLLIEVVSSTVKIADSVHQLASLARFKKISEDDASKSDQRNTERILRSPSIEGSHGLTISVE
ncbi:aluminum-activated malate transporter 2-like isoform X1 [Coffea arabica]|uniref:Aluminum-activated malate transporter 2-like isoform X1 n=1 Tax=Coffea arabica TaxID=13443 RepID=A0ABM4WHQ4_COFAR